MKSIYLIFAVVAVAAAQNPRKVGKHGKNAYLASSHGASGPSNVGGDHYGQSQYESPAPYSHQGHKTHHGGGISHNDKPAYSQLLADTRTLNQDGTINFNFQADNGLQQGETVDPDGTRRGFYSYPGADGKQITVKYTAGKNGFIAEGDHLPLQPQAAAHNEKENSENNYSAPKRQSHHGRHDTGAYNPPPPHQSGAYNGDESSGESDYKSPAPAPYRHNSPSGGGSRYQGSPGPSSHNNAPPSHYSSPSYSRGNDGGSSFVGFGGDFAPQGFSSPQPSRNNYAAAPSRGHSSGGSHNRSPQTFSSFGGPSSGGGPSPSYSSRAPSYSNGPSSHRGGGFTAANPYQGNPSGSGPYNGNFDLGNSGHFSINFAPGAEQEYQPGGEGSSHSPSTASYAGVRRPGPFGRRPSGARGQY